MAAYAPRRSIIKDVRCEIEYGKVRPVGVPKNEYQDSINEHLVKTIAQSTTDLIKSSKGFRQGYIKKGSFVKNESEKPGSSKLRLRNI